MKNIARVFPRRTNATPHDISAFVGMPPMMFLEELEIEEVHISTAFTYDIPVAEYLAKQWSILGVPIKIDGPAFDHPGGEFKPGMYLKKGYVITSRGCPNHCWFCKVPKREENLRELQIKDGWNVLDDNLLACSEKHINAVFEMLARQPERPLFTGGLEAAKLKLWHSEKLKELKTKRMYFTYDTPDDYEPLVEAWKLLSSAGFKFSSHIAYAYVLIGYKGDTFEKAEKRLKDTLKAGFMPYAMLYKDDKGYDGGEEDPKWYKFQREWIRPAIIVSQNKNLINSIKEGWNDKG